jgi:hypothetical protein
MKLCKLNKLTVLLSFLLVLTLVLVGMSTNTALSEWWTIHVARGYHLLFAWIFAAIPISIIEIIFILWFFILSMYLIRLVRFAIQKHLIPVLQTLQNLMIWFLIMTNVYLGTAGLAYARLPVPVPQFRDTIPYTDYEAVVETYRDEFNALSDQLTFDQAGSVINPYSLDELNTLIKEAFDSANLDSQYFTSYTTKVKPLLTSFLYREFHITGVHFAPTTEATINDLIPAALMPFTMAHELAHAKGVMREEDANLVALYVCLSSPNAYVRYSGLFNSFYALMNLLRYIGDPDAYGAMYQTLSLKIRRDFQYQNVFWSQFNLLDDIATWVNDTYLKLFGNEGVSSYVDVPDVITIEDGENTIEVIREFSPYQKLFLYFYFT